MNNYYIIKRQLVNHKEIGALQTAHLKLSICSEFRVKYEWGISSPVDSDDVTPERWRDPQEKKGWEQNRAKTWSPNDDKISTINHDTNNEA